MSYIKIPSYESWRLENFPFIEEDFDSLTTYELYCKVIEKLNEVIKIVNEHSTAIEALQVSNTAPKENQDPGNETV